jgi:ribosomal-protein-alanine N-acetyltransferase
MNTLARAIRPDLVLRPLARADLDAVLRIAADYPESHWLHDEFEECLRCRDCIGMVAEAKGKLIGFVVYRLDRSLREAHVKNVAVTPAWRRRGVGRSLLALVDDVWSEGYERIRMVVPETSVSLQLLLRAGGFRAVRVLRGWYGEEHAFLMQKWQPQIN